MTKLIFIRHGETEKNISEKLHDENDPETLNEKGIKQMRKTALELKKDDVSLIYCSTERRAKDSGKILSEELKIPLKKIHGMQERNWGQLSGRPWPEVATILDPMNLEDRYTYIPPGGESWKETEKRLIKAVNLVLSENVGKTVVIVSHGGAIRILMPYFLNASIEETFKHNPDNASLTIFNYDGKEFVKEKVNDTSHL